jgi:rod shape determining protein RodA
MIRFSLLKHLNIFPLIIIIVLVSIGLVMLYSAANGSFYPWGAKQLVRFGIGFMCMLIIAVIDSRYWLSFAYIFYGVVLSLLLAVESMGFIGMGAQRWIDLYAFNLQPSELMRIGVILALARYFHSCSLEDVRQIKTLVIPVAIILIPTILAMRQPDLGTAFMLLLSGSALLFVVGIRLWKFAAVGITGLACIPILWSCLYSYQQQRILIFLNPENDPTKSGYHITQSKIALGSGGILGKGFLQGSQSHLNFLPEKQTDFIFTMFSEEFGLVGAIILVSLYALLIAFNFQIALNARSQFGRLVAIGLTTTFFLYAFINMAMVMGFLPVVGIPLPFISYGGTAMITLLASQGLIFSVDLHKDIRIRRS